MKDKIKLFNEENAYVLKTQMDVLKAYDKAFENCRGDKVERNKRILFKWLNNGTYRKIGEEEKISVERVRQIIIKISYEIKRQKRNDENEANNIKRKEAERENNRKIAEEVLGKISASPYEELNNLSVRAKNVLYLNDLSPENAPEKIIEILKNSKNLRKRKNLGRKTLKEIELMFINIGIPINFY